ncbi:ABC transporter permease [Planotetraspora sp. A-T 1434]|uniref:ABC transporter permease n=1 Tax=Planotetraspora sp. A-T 1434 TaxID=2979219 RepID=UPI0021BEB247|nr:ABC transporter permease [Planotetraspora sp. A-T 1434]MCT9930327.1 ABC transporter permease [Planotetraspora sp. A-T 1434]
MSVSLRGAWRLPSVRLSLAVLAVVVALAVFGDWLSPLDPVAQNPAERLRGPSGGHLLGTDYLGRDVLSRLISGTGASVLGTLEAVGAGLVLGAVPGLVSVFFGRVYEWVAMRVADALLTLPFIIFAIAVAGVLGNGPHQAMLAIGVLLAPVFFRVTRASAIEFTRAQYVEAAELLGASRTRVVRTHVLGKVLPTIAVTTAGAAAASLLVVSSLSFLGIGVAPPAPTWGGVLASDLGFLHQQPLAPLAPALLIMITVGALNALADAVRDTTGVRADAVV